MKISSITKASSGDYVLYAENTVGNDTLTVRFYAEGMPGRSSSPPPDECSNDVNFYDSIQESKCPCVGNYSGVDNYSGGDRHCHSVEISFVQNL